MDDGLCQDGGARDAGHQDVHAVQPPQSGAVAGGGCFCTYICTCAHTRTHVSPTRSNITPTPPQHKQVGKVFTRAELQQLGAFCKKHELILLSDEIYHDLILDEAETPHVPIAALGDAELLKRTIVLHAASKTYNVPGLSCAYAIIPDEELRLRFKKAARYGFEVLWGGEGLVVCTYGVGMLIHGYATDHTRQGLRDGDQRLWVRGLLRLLQGRGAVAAGHAQGPCVGGLWILGAPFMFN